MGSGEIPNELEIAGSLESQLLGPCRHQDSGKVWVRGPSRITTSDNPNANDLRSAADHECIRSVVERETVCTTAKVPNNC